MKYGDENLPGIPDFMQKTSTNRSARTVRSSERFSFGDDYEIADFAKNNSVKRGPIRATRRRKKVDNSLWGRIKRNWKELAVSIGVTLAVFSGVSSFGDAMHEDAMIKNNPEVQRTNEIISDSISRTDDFQNWQLDPSKASYELKNLVENGGDPLIILGTLGNRLNEDYTQDELSSIVTNVFGEDPDTLVRGLNPERYEKGIHDADFKKDVQTYIVQKEEAKQALRDIDPNTQLESMLQSSEAYQNSNEKGMGGM